jgi:hypothetical protein
VTLSATEEKFIVADLVLVTSLVEEDLDTTWE